MSADTMKLPVLVRPGAETTLKRSRRVGHAVPRVLLVDDEPVLLRSVSRVLSTSWKVHTAVNAKAAVSMFLAQSYDAVVSDYDMPGNNGLWLLEKIREISPDTARILVSGSAPDIFDEFIASGLIQAFFPKPVDPVSLLSLYSI